MYLLRALISRLCWRQNCRFTHSHPRHLRVKLFAGHAKELPSFLSYFKTLTIAPAPGIKPKPSCSTIKHSIDWANLACINLDAMMHFPSRPYRPQHKGHNAIRVTIHYLITPLKHFTRLNLQFITDLFHLHHIHYYFTTITGSLCLFLHFNVCQVAKRMRNRLGKIPR